MSGFLLEGFDMGCNCTCNLWAVLCQCLVGIRLLLETNDEVNMLHIRLLVMDNVEEDPSSFTVTVVVR